MSYVALTQQTLMMTRQLLAASPDGAPHVVLAKDSMLLGKWASLTDAQRRTMLLTSAWMARTNDGEPVDLTESKIAVELVRHTRQWAAQRHGAGTAERFCAEQHPAHDIATTLATRHDKLPLLVLLTLTMHIPLEGRAAR